MTTALAQRDVLHNLLDQHGSPLHWLHRAPFERTITALEAAAAARGVDGRVFFARKANKALAFVDRARERGWGVDVASHEELAQVLDRGMAAEKLIVTAAVKPVGLLQLAVDHGVPIALDGWEELDTLLDVVLDAGREAHPVALRLGGFEHRGERLFTRFGFDAQTDLERVEVRWRHPDVAKALALRGMHFHLDGYDPAQRVSALSQTLPWIDRLRQSGHRIEFLDIGGGLPVRYLESSAQWSAFWQRVEAALLGRAAPTTYRGFAFGLQRHGDAVVGEPAVYPFAQERTAVPWLEAVLDAPSPWRASSVAEELARRNLQLRCEPGRSVLDGCGMTVARVEWVKDRPEGHRVVGLAMNRTQCRTGSLDYLVDPLWIPARGRSPSSETPDDVPTFLTGAYCIENEMLSWRDLRFPLGIARGDLVVWPNTAGYFMHFLESRSHQFPLAKNLVVDEPTRLAEARLDPLDAARPVPMSIEAVDTGASLAQRPLTER